MLRSQIRRLKLDQPQVQLELERGQAPARGEREGHVQLVARQPLARNDRVVNYGCPFLIPAGEADGRACGECGPARGPTGQGGVIRRLDRYIFELACKISNWRVTLQNGMLENAYMEKC
jgi:hypothetical protein